MKTAAGDGQAQIRHARLHAFGAEASGLCFLPAPAVRHMVKQRQFRETPALKCRPPEKALLFHALRWNRKGRGVILQDNSPPFPHIHTARIVTGTGQKRSQMSVTNQYCPPISGFFTTARTPSKLDDPTNAGNGCGRYGSSLQNRCDRIPEAFIMRFCRDKVLQFGVQACAKPQFENQTFGYFGFNPVNRYLSSFFPRPNIDKAEDKNDCFIV